jgi:DNA invertase Pin-like site-specific DNA recombinase
VFAAKDNNVAELVEAVIYIRFSSAEQSKGHSKARQLKMCQELCASKGWVISQTLCDEGKSAFSGKHREAGSAFGDFEQEALNHLHGGKILVAEKLDRLSRQTHHTTVAMINSLCAAGLNIATCDGAFYAAYVEPDLLQTLTMLITSEANNAESKKKSVRIREAKADARFQARATGRIITKNAPPWLKITAGKFVVIEERAAIVRQIFERADMGSGYKTLTKWMNEQAKTDPAFKPWNSRGGAGWHQSFITRLLVAKSVLGEFQPNEMVAGVRTPEGEPIADYFPSIVDVDLFERVTGNAQARKRVRGGGNSPQIANLLSGLTRCSVCNSTMSFVVNRNAGSTYTTGGKKYVRHNIDAVLICSAARRNHGTCANRATISYHSLEKAILDSCLHLALDDQSFARVDEVGQLNIRIAEFNRSHTLAMSKAQNLWTAYAEGGSPMAMRLAENAETIATDLKTELDRLNADRLKAAGRAGNAEHLRRVSDIRENLYHPDLEIRIPLRRKVLEALPSAITAIFCDEDRAASVLIAGGLKVLKIIGGKVVSQAETGLAPNSTTLRHGNRPTANNARQVQRRLTAIFHA